MSRLMNAGEYEESLRKLRLKVYLFGKRVENVVDDPIIRPSMKAVAATYEFAHRPEYENILTATSHLSGRKISRFTHIHQSTDDLLKKSNMGRLMGSLTACCFQRCVGTDALNALSISTYAVDRKHGTEYNRLRSFEVVGIDAEANPFAPAAADPDAAPVGTEPSEGTDQTAATASDADNF